MLTTIYRNKLDQKLVIMFDFLADIFDSAGDFISDLFDSGADEVAAGVIECATAGWIIAGVISVAELTVDTIKSELSRRAELKNKDVMSVIVKEILRENNATVVTLDAISRANECVGQVKMESSRVHVTKGQKILIP